jgi:hypothetical protein
VFYANHIRSLAYLVDAGVPSYDALRLVGLDFERVDATRLGRAFQAARARSRGMDIFTWLMAQSDEAISLIVRGTDQRSLDFDLTNVLARVRVELQRQNS